MIPRVLDQKSGILTGHDQIRPFPERDRRSPQRAVRWYRTGRYFFDGQTLIWEYPRHTPAGHQVDLVEVMDLQGPRIAYHRIYWGWFGTPLLMPKNQ